MAVRNLRTNTKGHMNVFRSKTLRACTALAIHFFQTVVSARAASCVAPPSGLVGWWKGEAGAQDSAGANHGSLVGGASIAPGKVGNGFLFDGSTGYVLVPHSATLNFSNELTIELWYKSTQSNDVYYGLIDKRVPGFGNTSANYGINVTSTGYGGLGV